MQYSISKMVHNSYQQRHKRQKKNSNKSPLAFKLISINIRGQGSNPQVMRRRMKEWRTKINKQNIDIILVQETHISTIAQVIYLQNLWINGWGITSTTNIRPWSSWSVGSSSSAGVGILINPRTQLQGVSKIPNFSNTSRIIAIKTADFMVVNVYAPTNGKIERENFFKHLTEKLELHLDANSFIIAGDFNCCLSPLTDRQYSQNRSSQTESPNLSSMLLKMDLVDALDLLEPFKITTLTKEHIDISEYFTYHRANAASRIDRFYLSKKLTSMFGDLSIWSSAIYSDHQCLDLTLRDPYAIPQGFTETKIYPTTIKNQKLQHQAITICLKYIYLEQNKWPDVMKVWELGKLLVAYLLKKLKQHDIRQQKWLHQIRKQRLKKECANQDYNPTFVNYVLRKEQSIQKAAILMEKINYDRFSAMTNQHSSTKFYNRYKQSKDFKLISAIDGPESRSIDSVANNMLIAWSTVFKTHHPSKRAAIKRTAVNFPSFVPTIKMSVSKDMNHDLTAPFHIEELTKAIKKMKNKKTAGPDLISNEFYKIYQDLLIPILIKVFNCIIKDKCMPPSFQTARIYPQKKRGDSKVGLNYRPIACLNGDYKLLTRVLAERMKPVLNNIIGESQHGGLPGRHLNGAIYKAQAAMQNLQKNNTSAVHQSSALMFLDIQKAYDSLEREFVYTALKQFKFSPDFISIIKAIHTHTAAYFVVNGLSSRMITLTRGIRQGCPVAPLIFILAVEVLLLRINHSDEIQGINFTTPLNSTTITTVAFIDDTTIFLQQLKQLPALLRILDDFAGVSGLKINRKKTKLLMLNPDLIRSHHSNIPVLQLGQYISFLGIQLGYHNLAIYNWEIVKKKLLKRMLFLVNKTSNMISRRKILTNVIGAQISFIAQYFIPTKQFIKGLQQDISDIFWQGFRHKSTETTPQISGSDYSATDTASRRPRNPLATEMTLLPQAHGGLGVLDVSFSIMTTVLRMACRWVTLAPSQEKTAIDCMIIQQTSLTRPVVPLQRYGKKGLRIYTTDKFYWHYAIKIFSQTTQTQYKIAEYNRLLSDVRTWLWKIPLIKKLSNRRVKWSIPYYDKTQWQSFSKKRDRIISSQLCQHILNSPIKANPFLTDKEGKVYKTIALKNKTFYDMIVVHEWTDHSGTIEFKTQTKRSEELLTAFIILGLTRKSINSHVWPEMYGTHSYGDRLCGYNQLNNRLELKATNLPICAPYINFDIPLQFSNLKTTVATAYVPFSFPFISALLWREDYYNNTELKENFRKKRIKHVIQKQATIMFYEKYIHFKIKRHSKWSKQYESFKPIWQHPTMHRPAWRKLHAMGVENFWLRFIYNIHKFWWSEYHEHPECPIPFCKDTNYNNKWHVFFTCVRAKFIYTRLLRWWLGHSNYEVAKWFQSVFTSIPLQLPINLIITNTSNSFWLQHFEIIWTTLKTIWKIATQLIPVYIWQHRNELLFQQIERNNIQAWNEIWEIIRSNLTSLSDHFKRRRKKDIVRIIDIYINTPVPNNFKFVHVKMKPEYEYLGWFDGGHRSKTDDGAAGSVLLAAKSTNIKIIAAKSEYLGQMQTNNSAEYQALFNLTELAHHRQINQLIIRGDSKMIVNQLSNIHNCRKPKLRLTLAKSLLNLRNTNYTVLHVKRSWNQAADFLANLANDTLMTQHLKEINTDLQQFTRLIKYCNIDITHEEIPLAFKPLPEIDKSKE